VYQIKAYRPGLRYPDRPGKLDVPDDMDPLNKK
jgi:flagellar biosynthetic protein FlhB